MAVGALEIKFWRALCVALERPDWAERHWSLGLVPGSAASMALRTEVAGAFVTQPMAHWARHFDAVDACVTPVLRLDELDAHPVHAAGQLESDSVR
jgi:crotonobetainyl-CoA:carnitine CoA-transferase CaiB-like acyl-CoA transferase